MFHRRSVHSMASQDARMITQPVAHLISHRLGEQQTNKQSKYLAKFLGGAAIYCQRICPIILQRGSCGKIVEWIFQASGAWAWALLNIIIRQYQCVSVPMLWPCGKQQASLEPCPFVG